MTTPTTPAPMGNTTPHDKTGQASPYFMAMDKSPGGGLVLLSDVVRWLIASGPMPCRPAVEQVCAAITGTLAGGGLYMVQPNDYAQPLGPGHCFNVPAVVNLNVVAAEDPADCGVAGVVKWMRAFWAGGHAPGAGNYLGQEVLDPLAIPLPLAYDLWGYGTAPAAIDPPQGWELHGTLGFMAYKEGNAGQLVRLADLLRWLEQTRSLPRASAVEVLCSALPLDAMGWLYQVQKLDHAKPVPLDSGFGYQTAGQIAAADRARNAPVWRDASYSATTWGYSHPAGIRTEARKITTKVQTPTEPGLPALLRLTRHIGGLAKGRKATCEPLDDARGPFALLAIPISKAHALWGYGTVRVADVAVVDAVAVADASMTIPLAEWTGKKLLAEQTVLKRAGVRNYTQSLVEQSGLTERDVRRLIAEYKAAQSSAVGSMVTTITSGRKTVSAR